MDAKDLFEILVRENADMLMVYLRAITRDATAADDLFQETMLTAWKKIDEFDRSRPFGPWLRGIAARLALAHRRKSADADLLFDVATLEHLDHRLSQVQTLAGDTLDEKLDAVRHCLAALPAAFRQAITLRYHEELRPAELTELLKLSGEAVKKRLQRARALLLDCVLAKLSTAEVSS
ncbi:MAG: sigma-70 family RNA polymerase sigma factor [Pirellulales bacterium]